MLEYSCSWRRSSVAFLLLGSWLSAQQPALRGLDPVALCGGQELAGAADFTIERGGHRYQFANADNRALFEREPGRYEIQLGGACARMGPLSGAGDPQRFHVHRERIYIFASDQCRAGFIKRTDAFLATDEPVPMDPASIAAGRQMVERAAAGHGGVDRLRAWRSYRHEHERKDGDITERWRTTLRLPAAARFEHDYTQGEKTWRYANVVDGETGWSLANDKSQPLGGDAVRELQRNLAAEPLVALRLVLDGAAVAVPAGEREVAGIAVVEFAVWCHGQVVTFGLGADGLVATSRCRGRGPGLWFGALERVFADHREHGGLLVPGAVRGFFDGKEDAKLHERREQIVVDAELSASLFTAPK
jgi:YHS domain-containing protein